MNLIKRVDITYTTYSVRDRMSTQFYLVTQNQHQSWNIVGRVEISLFASINKTSQKYHNILSWLTPVPHITLSPFIASHLLLYHWCPSPSPSINRLHSNPSLFNSFAPFSTWVKALTVPVIAVTTVYFAHSRQLFNTEDLYGQAHSSLKWCSDLLQADWFGVEFAPYHHQSGECTMPELRAKACGWRWQ